MLNQVKKLIKERVMWLIQMNWVLDWISLSESNMNPGM